MFNFSFDKRIIYVIIAIIIEDTTNDIAENATRTIVTASIIPPDNVVIASA